MKRLSFAFALLVMMAVPAFAAGGGVAPYVEAKLGGSYTQIDSIKNTSPVAVPAPVNKTSVDDVIGVAGLAVGLNLKNLGVPVRVEVDYAYRSNMDYNPNPTFIGAAIPTSLKSTMDSQTLFANVYYDIETGTAFTPYVGGGLGMSWNHTKSTGTILATGVEGAAMRQTANNFAWNIGAGCAYDLTANWKLNAGYRYVDLGKVTWGDSSTSMSSTDITSHEVLLGLRYQF